MEEARVQPAGVAVTKPVLVLGFDDTGQLMVSVLDGTFECANPQLSPCPEAIDRDCYGGGWLYEASGSPLPECVDAPGYQQILNET